MSNPVRRPVLLTDTQREVLSAAARRPEGAIILPARLKGKAAQSVAKALLDKALVREIRAKGDLPAWRMEADTGRGFALILTKAGRALVTDPAQGEPKPVASLVSSDVKQAVPASPTTPRQGSKLAEVIALLGREQGTSVADLMAATGWLPHTTRAALTGLRKRGYALTREAGESGSLYRIGAAPTVAAVAA